MTRSAFAVPPGPEGVGAARRFTWDRLVDWGLEGIADTVVLLVSEAVTNVLLHAGSPASLCLDVSSTRLRAEIRDSSITPPSPKGYENTASTGRGLLMIEGLASRWGADIEDEGKVVWFEVSLGPQPDAALTVTRAETGHSVPGATRVR